MKTTQYLLFTALAATLLGQTPQTWAADKGVRQITFQKCFVAGEDPFGGTFEGTAEADGVAGIVSARFLSLTSGKAIWGFSAEYTIDIPATANTPGYSFKAVCAGIEDVRTGHIVLNGVVSEAEGPYLGAQVQVRAQDNADLTCSHGTMTITPSE